VVTVFIVEFIVEEGKLSRNCIKNGMVKKQQVLFRMSLDTILTCDAPISKNSVYGVVKGKR